MSEQRQANSKDPFTAALPAPLAQVDNLTQDDLRFENSVRSLPNLSAQDNEHEDEDLNFNNVFTTSPPTIASLRDTHLSSDLIYESHITMILPVIATQNEEQRKLKLRTEAPPRASSISSPSQNNTRNEFHNDFCDPFSPSVPPDSCGKSEVSYNGEHARGFASSTWLGPTLDGQSDADGKLQSGVIRTEASLEAFSTNPMLAAFRRAIHGWRAGLLICMWADTIVFMTFLGFLTYCVTGTSIQNLRSTIFYGSCSKTDALGTWLHLPINILGTMVLASGSYTMQCLTAPTRHDLDKAHSRGSWMEIGVPSFHNLLKISPRRVLLYMLTFSSSLPFHILANSAVFEIYTTNSYFMAVTGTQFENYLTEDWTTGWSNWNSTDEFRISAAPNTDSVTVLSPSEQDNVRFVQDPIGTLLSLRANMTRLSNSDCIREYSNPLISKRRHVIAIAEDFVVSNFSAQPLAHPLYYQSVDYCKNCQSYLSYTDPSIWICAFTVSTQARKCDSSTAIAQARRFSIHGFKISHCLSEPATEKCQLQSDIGILTVLLIVTAIKICLLGVVLRTLPPQIIATLGDAVSSFVTEPDEMTRGSCLLNRGDIYCIKKKNNQNISFPIARSQTTWMPGVPFRRQWYAKLLERRWSAGPRCREWLALITLLGVGFAFVCLSLGVGIVTLQQKDQPSLIPTYQPPTDLASLRQMGFGKINVNFLLRMNGIKSADGLIQRVLLVNTLQVYFSIMYFAFNSVWTRMIISREWASYGTKRQGLRVSGQPVGYQRSSYFLTIPYRYALPLQIGSALLHWLCSQSFFLARINVEPGRPFVETENSVINTVGYSLFALIILVIFLAIVMTTLIVAVVLGKLKSPMPMAGANSLIISAACHPPNSLEEIATKPLKWGVVDEMDDDGFKHCSFSAGEVYSPEELTRTGSKPNIKTELYFS